ncbi:hypothetical protein XA68_12108 [Ophiocordyceps unilateralis]|uniref:Major facilitator superfamily (MFS) profile domain-containing protein n=1 Tax=Ophiocordyceps unilateralis TaxID=268505 RepID=A0A2A9PF04_OPHUN|nr:hypothetical protein XA68_12108 [Ophiocordyceps unilateralis]
MTPLPLLTLLLAVGTSSWGTSTGVVGPLLAHETFSHLGGWVRGSITAAYYVGTLASYLVLGPRLADGCGRRPAVMVGPLLLSIGAVLLSRAHALPLVLGGRCVIGLGAGLVSSLVPLYAAEVAARESRGKVVAGSHAGFVAGVAAGLWVGASFRHRHHHHHHHHHHHLLLLLLLPHQQQQQQADESWRLIVLLPLLPATLFIAAFYFWAPETPRWLAVQANRPDEAGRVLCWLRGGRQEDGNNTTTTTTDELHALLEPPDSSDAAAHSVSIRPRLVRAFALQLIAQLCGATAAKYYLPQLLRRLGVPTRAALVAGAAEMTAKLPMTLLEMWAIDALGRSFCLVAGCLVMALALLINGALPLLYPHNSSPAADAVCVVFIFVYALGYSLGLGPAAWVYSSEIFPTPLRARGLNWAASGGALGSLVVSFVWPIGIAHLGSAVYFFFMAFNLACVPIIYIFYPETKGRALEDMDALFANQLPNRPSLPLNSTAIEPGDAPDEDAPDEDAPDEDAPLLPPRARHHRN